MFNPSNDDELMLSLVGTTTLKTEQAVTESDVQPPESPRPRPDVHLDTFVVESKHFGNMQP